MFLGLLTSLVQSRIVNKNVVCLHGNEIEPFLSRSSSIQQSVPPLLVGLWLMEETALQLKAKLARLLPPYVALGFDQRMVARNRAPVTARMGDFQTIEHLSQYGRPLYAALVHQRQMLTFEPGGVRIYLKKNAAK